MTVTRILTVEPDAPDEDAISSAASHIADGRLVAFPTETVYGLGANAFDATAVARIFAAKQRPFTDPLIVHVASVEQIGELTVEIPPSVGPLAERFWPGPLTLILRRGSRVPPNVSAGRNTVAVRIPAHPVARALLAACALPIAAPSANLFGRPSPTKARHVLEDLDGRIDLVVDGGPTTIGVESTVVDLTGHSPALLRPGGAPLESLWDCLPDLRVPELPEVVGDSTAAMSPGMLLKHYSPHAMLILLRGEASAAQRQATAVTARLRAHGKRCAVMVPDEEARLYADLPIEVIALGPLTDLPVIARSLFDRLRELDHRGVDVILAREPGHAGLGLAIRDRLFRAAEGHVIDAGRPVDLDGLMSRINQD
jgi:L-threonylcarbamoyladenylate synthase